MDGSGSITIGLGEFRLRRGKAWRRGNEMKKETEAVRGNIEGTRARFSFHEGFRERISSNWNDKIRD